MSWYVPGWSALKQASEELMGARGETVAQVGVMERLQPRGRWHVTMHCLLLLSP